MTDTPRTDAALVPFIAVTKGELIGELVRADDMRELERENAALRKARDLYERALLTAFPYGAKDDVFEAWNQARITLRDAAMEKKHD